MEVIKKYVIYELNNVMGSESHKALEEVKFDSWQVSNSFDTEDEAVKALIDNEKAYIDYIILRKVIIREV